MIGAAIALAGATIIVAQEHGLSRATWRIVAMLGFCLGWAIADAIRHAA